MFDIGTMNFQAPADAGKVMVLKNPGTGLDILDDKGDPVTITLHGQYSQAVLNATMINTNQRLDNQRESVKTSGQTLYAETTEILVAATKAWSFTELDGEPFPCNMINARKFWRDQRFAPFRDQAYNFVHSAGNFTPA